MRPDVDLLRDIVKTASELDLIVVGLDEDTFSGTDVVRSAAMYKLIVIGEAAAKLTDGLRQQFGHVPWPAIISFGPGSALRQAVHRRDQSGRGHRRSGSRRGRDHRGRAGGLWLEPGAGDARLALCRPSGSSHGAGSRRLLKVLLDENFPVHPSPAPHRRRLRGRAHDPAGPERSSRLRHQAAPGCRGRPCLPTQDTEFEQLAGDVRAVVVISRSARASPSLYASSLGWRAPWLPCVRTGEWAVRPRRGWRCGGLAGMTSRLAQLPFPFTGRPLLCS